MSEPTPATRFRFGVFEADTVTGELRRQGTRIRIHAQPFQLLCLLLQRPGELVTREEIAQSLWPDGTFVDFDHGVNSAINRLREALGDTAANPRFVETLARRGYRFVAPVERVSPASAPPAAEPADAAPEPLPAAILATPAELPTAPRPVVRALFLALQLMYVGFYVGALANLAEIEQLLEPLPWPGAVELLLIATAAALLPVRAFLLTAAVFRPPRARAKLLRLWPFVAPLDVLWALSPFLLLHHIDFGLALACVALLVYAPFAQRSLVLMGAGGESAA